MNHGGQIGFDVLGNFSETSLNETIADVQLLRCLHKMAKHNIGDLILTARRLETFATVRATPTTVCFIGSAAGTCRDRGRLRTGHPLNAREAPAFRARHRRRSTMPLA